MSDPANWYEWIKISAFVAGIVFGGFAVASPSWVWLKKQLMPVAAVWLAGVGMVLISMSIWQSVEIEGPGLKLRIAELTKAVALQGAVISANAQLTLAGAPKSRELFGDIEGVGEIQKDSEETTAYKNHLEKLLQEALGKYIDYRKSQEYWPLDGLSIIWDERQRRDQVE
jgi:hypothetical protein